MKVLVVDDEKELNKAIRKVFQLSNIDSDPAYDGIEALEMLQYGQYDVIVLDVMMPRLDGFKTVKAIRERGDSTPIIMLTAKNEIDDKVEGLDAGADDYLGKPFQIKELVARVRALARRKKVFVESYSIGDLTLDNKTFELVAKKRVHLTSKEYKLMESLIRNKDILTSTEKLMDLVWDYDSEAEINVVWSYLSSLRRKLAQSGSKVKLVAVRGLGYKLEEK